MTGTFGYYRANLETQIHILHVPNRFIVKDDSGLLDGGLLKVILDEKILAEEFFHLINDGESRRLLEEGSLRCFEIPSEVMESFEASRESGNPKNAIKVAAEIYHGLDEYSEYIPGEPHEYDKDNPADWRER